MKTVTKLLMGAAVLAAQVGAAHAANSIVPSTDNGNLLFFVNDANAHTTYTVVLSQQINSATGGYFTNADALSATPDSLQGAGTLKTINGDKGFTYTFGSTSQLASFMNSATAAGDSLQWGIIGGAYSGTTPSTRTGQGSVLAVVTAITANHVVSVGESGMDGGIPTDINKDVGSLNAQTLDSESGTPHGIFGSPTSAGSTNLTLYGNGVDMAGALIGQTYGLYGITTNGTTGGDGETYSLGNVSFNGTQLTFTGNTGNPPPIPLPAAVWLFGSGLLGLLGIGRRRESAAAV